MKFSTHKTKISKHDILEFIIERYLNNMSKPFLSVVVPVFKEEKVINLFYSRLCKTLGDLTESYEIIFCLDPSPDKTENLLNVLTSQDNRVKLIKFSRRFGQPAATMAGIINSSGQRCVIIDADLQDPPELIKDLNNKMDEGFDVVYAIRNSREGENIFKRVVAKVGYYLVSKLSDVTIPRETGDFRIISRRIVEELSKLNDKDSFLRGLVAYVGFNQTGIIYDRDSRYAGQTKYNKFFGSIRIGMNGVIGFSSRPLNILSYFGILVAMVSFLTGIIYFIQKISGYNLSPGLSTTVILISFLAGIQLISMGILGAYISRIYEQVKSRPTYIIEKITNFDH